jgi:hypothetical protein
MYLDEIIYQYSNIVHYCSVLLLLAPLSLVDAISCTWWRVTTTLNAIRCKPNGESTFESNEIRSETAIRSLVQLLPPVALLSFPQTAEVEAHFSTRTSTWCSSRQAGKQTLICYYHEDGYQ